MNKLAISAIIVATVLVGGMFFNTVILAEKQTFQGSPFDELRTTIQGLQNTVNDLQTQINNIQVIPGSPSPQNEQTSQGEQTPEDVQPSTNAGTSNFGERQCCLSSPSHKPQSQQIQTTSNYDYKNSQCQQRYGNGYYYDPSTNACLPPSGSWSSQGNDVAYQNQQCQAKYGQGFYYDAQKNKCLPPGGSWANYSTQQSTRADPNAECQQKYWWVKGIYYDGNGCVPPGGWANFKVLKYNLVCLGCVNYTIDVSGLKDEIEKSIITGQPFDTQSRPRIPYDDSPGNRHIEAKLWFSIQPTGGNNVYFVVHLDNAIIDGVPRGDKQMDGNTTYHPEDGTIKGTKSISELQKMFDEWTK